MMKAVLLKEYGGPEVMYIGNHPEPVMTERDILVEVKAAGINRADLLQRRGFYPAPHGASKILGLEMAGEVLEVGSDVTQWRPGDRVCALLPGGGYAQRVAVPEEMAIKLPDHFTYEQGAAIPEVFLTAYLNLFRLGRLKSGQTVLVHAGASGVGTAAIQLIREADARAIVTAGSKKKIERCLELGAASGWNYHDGSFADWVKEQTGGRGADIILDFVGADYFADNIRSLAVGGRLIVIGTLGGSLVKELHLSELLSRRLQIIGTALRPLSIEEKIALTREFAEFAWPRFADGRLVPVIDSVFGWEDVRKAHEYMESNANIGKIILKM